MCGIFGILQHNSATEPPAERLRATAGRLQHRGPDGHGFYSDQTVGLVHTRLSLLDLSDRSNQPFWDDTRRYCLVYNGELYNYVELRRRLERRGVAFHTTSDTEVLLHSLIQQGIEATMPQLDGMFAFGLYDSYDKSLVLGRDRFGIKPLYVYDGDAAFVFASTIGAMQPWVPFEPDAVTLTAFLHGSNGPMSGRTFYDRITNVPPGTVVHVKSGCKPRFTSCLAMSDLIDGAHFDELATLPLGDIVDRTEQLLLKSVEGQLNADVPVGAFCSGGVDSSLIMAMAARFHGDLRVFHADIAGPLSERPAAQRLAEYLKLDLKVVQVLDRHFVESIPDVVENFGFPFVNPTAVPLLHVSRLVQENGIKAVLCGEGSDEWYLGYPWLVPNIRTTIRHLPQRVLRKLAGGRSAGAPPASRDRQLVVGMAAKFEIEVGAVTFGSARATDNTRGKLTPSPATDGDLSYILRSLLHRNDAMGMAAGIEARFPFLDSNLVKQAVNLPYESKVRFSPLVLDPDHPFYRDKWVVRQVAARYLPPELSQRRKRMFPTNAYERFQIADSFFENSFVSDWFGLSDPGLRYLLGNASSRLRLRLLLIEAWGHLCIRGMPKDDLSRKLARSVRVGTG